MPWTVASQIREANWEAHYKPLWELSKNGIEAWGWWESRVSGAPGATTARWTDATSGLIRFVEEGWTSPPYHYADETSDTDLELTEEATLENAIVRIVELGGFTEGHHMEEPESEMRFFWDLTTYGAQEFAMYAVVADTLGGDLYRLDEVNLGAHELWGVRLKQSAANGLVLDGDRRVLELGELVADILVYMNPGAHLDYITESVHAYFDGRYNL